MWCSWFVDGWLRGGVLLGGVACWLLVVCCVRFLARFVVRWPVLSGIVCCGRRGSSLSVAVGRCWLFVVYWLVVVV